MRQSSACRGGNCPNGAWSVMNFERLVGLRRRRDVREAQRHAGYDLNDERHQRGAPKGVPPARIVRHEMLGGGADQIDDAEPVVDPVPDSERAAS